MEQTKSNQTRNVKGQKLRGETSVNDRGRPQQGTASRIKKKKRTTGTRAEPGTKRQKQNNSETGKDIRKTGTDVRLGVSAPRLR